MSSLTATYNLNVTALVPWFEAALQYPVDALAVSKYGSLDDAISAEFTQLPTAVTDGNYESTQQRIERIIASLKTSHLYEKTRVLQSNISQIENLLSTGVRDAPSKTKSFFSTYIGTLTGITTGICLGPLTGVIVGVVAQSLKTTWPIWNSSSPEVQLARVTQALPLIKEAIKFDPMQKKSLAAQPPSGVEVIAFSEKCTYEMKAQIFNISTLMILRSIAYGTLGIMGFKTLVISTVVFYLLRRVAEESMALTNVERYMTIPAIVPIPIPVVPVYAIPGFNISIPTGTGIKQLATKIVVMCSNLWNNNGSWKPNCLEINGIVILKNGIVPLNEWGNILKSAFTG